MSKLSISSSRPLYPRSKAIIIGASSGIGASLAFRLAEEGYVLALVSRNENKLKKLCDSINDKTSGEAVYFVHDVTDDSDIFGLFVKICSQIGGLDLFIYNAGIQFPSDPEIFSSTNDLDVFQVNLLGAVRWLNLVGERFRKLNKGHIVSIGSIAGDRGRGSMSAYSASKSGLHTYMEGFRNRLVRHGVIITTIKPGQVKTDLLKNAHKEMWPVSSEFAANCIYNAIKKRRMVAYVPARWYLVGMVICLIPSIIFRRLNI